MRTSDLLPFISTCIWQVIVLIAFVAFRVELKLLIGRVRKLVIGRHEAEFLQEVSEDAVQDLEGDNPDAGTAPWPTEFLTQEKIESIVKQKVQDVPGEEVVGSLLVFQINRQQTWLVASTKRLFCLLDDERTRRSKKLIQWQAAKTADLHVKAKKVKPTYGYFEVGEQPSKLYSVDLYPESKELEDQIKALGKKPVEV